MAWFDFVLESEIDNPEVVEIFDKRLTLLADSTDIDKQRLRDWVFVRLVLGACWNVEDGVLPGCFLKKAIRFFDGN